MSKRIIAIIATVCMLCVGLFALTACDLFGKEGVGIEKIEKTDTKGLVDTYTITLTNGETSTFTVTNGKDGTNGNGTSDLSTDPNAPTPNDYFCFERLEDGTYAVFARYKDMPKRIVIPSTYEGKPVTKVGECFSGYSSSSDRCRSVEEIVIPDSVTIIGDAAFIGYRTLKSITIPASVTHIDDGAFWMVSGYTVDYKGTKAQWDAIDHYVKWEQSYSEDYTLKCSDGSFEIQPQSSGK